MTELHTTLNKPLKPLALGGWVFGEGQWQAEQKAALLTTMNAALACGINHFDTASDYGDGASEKVMGEFLNNKREQVFLASKANVDVMNTKLMLEQIDQSLKRLDTNMIDLYYIHWPRQGKDLRPLMEGLVQAKEQGKIRFIGVSNFSVAQMEQVSEVGKIDAHQLGYNLFWRVAEKDVIPYCQSKDITVVTYSSIAQGILTGKFARELHLTSTDQRNGIVFFSDALWPHIYKAVEELKVLANEVQRPLVHLAIRWVLQQPGIHSAIVGAKNEAQLSSNVTALEGELRQNIFERMTEISDRAAKHLPNTENMYDYHP